MGSLGYLLMGRDDPQWGENWLVVVGPQPFACFARIILTEQTAVTMVGC